MLCFPTSLYQNLILKFKDLEVNTQELRSMVERLRNEANMAGSELVSAEHALKISIRRSLISGDTTESDKASVLTDACRNNYQNARKRLEEGEELFRLSIESDRAAAFSALRNSVSTRCEQLEQFGSDIDAKLAELVSTIQNARDLEARIQADIARVDPQRSPIGRQLNQVSNDMSNRFRSWYVQGAIDVSGLASVRTRDGASALRRSVGLGS